VKKSTFRCACCRRILPRNPRIKEQEYCGAKLCQRARKSKWQREKQQTDPDYRANRRESQRAWRKKNPLYWRRYRHKNHDYCKRNRELQRVRDKAEHRKTVADENLAKMDALERILNHTSTTYLISANRGNLAKMDALSVKIIPVTAR